MIKIINQISAGFVLSVMIVSSVPSVVYADEFGFGEGYTDIGSFYGSGYTDIPSTYGSGYTDIPSTYGSGYTDIQSFYGSGYTDIPSVYGSGYTDISSYGSGYTDIPSVYGSGYTDIPSVYDYGSGYTDIPSTYGSGYTDIPSTYGSGYTDLGSGYNYGTGYTDLTSGYSSYGTGYTDISSGYGTGYTTIPSTYGPGVSWTGYGSTGGTGYIVNPTPVVPVTPFYVCPNGTTVTYASQCSTIVQPCPGNMIRLANGQCSCPSGMTLVGTTCQLTVVTPACTGDLVRLANGQCGCPAGTQAQGNNRCRVITTQQCIRTQIYEPNVARYNNDYPACTKVCTNGQTVSAGASCPNVVTPPPVVYCSDGLPPLNNSCTRTTVIPTTNNTICSDGSYPSPITGCSHVTVIPTTHTQVCWDGSTLPLNSVCPSQYKLCNGTSIPIYQECRVVTPYPPYIPPQVVKFNNVVTAPVTEITNKSARCNGIGLIANGAQSTGWFEYGETANLGRQTATAAIGSALTAPFSNALTNLKPSTTYYCRAVMQNQYGVVKGEIVRFTTKSKVVTYVKPVTTVKKTTTKVVKKNEIVCIDGSIVTVGQSTATLINEGQKLVALQIEKTSGNLASDTTVIYKLTYKNLSDTSLSGVVIKVTVPQEVTVTSSLAGTYDATTRTITFTPGTLNANAEGMITWTGKVDKNAQIGKTLVTTAYIGYTVPGTQTQDEVTAYITGSVVTPDAGATTGAKKVIGSGDRGFLPGSMVEWLALIAILFIIFILGRSIYASYKEGDNRSH